MKFTTLIVAAAFALALPAGLATAQTATTPAPTATTTAEKVVKSTKRTGKRAAAKAKSVATTVKTRSEASLACSADANTKGLHGKDRRTFRKTCLAQKKLAS